MIDAKKLMKQPKTKLVDLIQELSQSLSLANARPVQINAPHPICPHGHQMQLRNPKDCPACIKPERNAFDVQAEFDSAARGWAEREQELRNRINEKQIIISYLENLHGVR